MSMVRNYVKKPLTVEAVRLTEDTLALVTCWVGPTGFDIDRDGLIIKTLEGDMRARTGDWIIKGVKGEFYPCKADVFEATYDPAPRDEDRYMGGKLEAWRVAPDNLQSIAQWLGRHEGYDHDGQALSYIEYDKERKNYMVSTGSGDLTADEGDWIARRYDGGFRVYTHGVFDRLFPPAPERKED